MTALHPLTHPDWFSYWCRTRHVLEHILQWMMSRPFPVGRAQGKFCREDPAKHSWWVANTHSWLLTTGKEAAHAIKVKCLTILEMILYCSLVSAILEVRCPSIDWNFDCIKQAICIKFCMSRMKSMLPLYRLDRRCFVLDCSVCHRNSPRKPTRQGFSSACMFGRLWG